MASVNWTRPTLKNTWLFSVIGIPVRIGQHPAESSYCVDQRGQTSTPVESTEFPGSKKFFRLGETQVLFTYRL